MEHALVLSVFGEAKLLQGEETVLTAPLPLLIAAFVVIEHNGEAASREAVFQYFFPQEPIAPNAFSKLSQVIYQQLWRHLALSPSNPMLYLTTDFLQEQTGQVLSKSHFQRAHVQLEDYAIIEQALQKEQGYQYRVDSRLQRYLTADGKTGTDKVQLARKTFSAHLSTLRAKAPEFVPAGKTGASRQALIIQLPCTATCLEQALQSCELEKIRELHGASFLLKLSKPVVVICGCRRWCVVGLKSNALLLSSKCSGFCRKQRIKFIRRCFIKWCRFNRWFFNPLLRDVCRLICAVIC